MRNIFVITRRSVRGKAQRFFASLRMTFGRCGLATHAPALARFPPERKQRAMVGAIHDCIISDTLAKRFSRNGFEAENDDENDNGMSAAARSFLFVRPS